MYDIQRSFPDFNCGMSNSGLTIIGQAKPTPLSRVYTIKIQLLKKGSPRVWITNPNLKEIEKRRIPHRYKDGSLCLYYPPNREWTRQRFLSETIVPWTLLWLYYYEIWKITGKWKGGGHEPTEE